MSQKSIKLYLLLLKKNTLAQLSNLQLYFHKKLKETRNIIVSGILFLFYNTLKMKIIFNPTFCFVAKDNQ